MKTGLGSSVITVALLLACLALAVAAAVQTMAQSGTIDTVEATVTEGETMIAEGSKPMMVGANRIPDAVRTTKDWEDSAKAGQMLTDAEILRYGMMRAEAMLAEGPRRVAKDAKKITAGSKTEKSH